MHAVRQLGDRQFPLTDQFFFAGFDAVGVEAVTALDRQRAHEVGRGGASEVDRHLFRVRDIVRMSSRAGLVEVGDDGGGGIHSHSAVIEGSREMRIAGRNRLTGDAERRGGRGGNAHETGSFLSPDSPYSDEGGDRTGIHHPMRETVPTQGWPGAFGHLRAQSHDDRIRRPSRLELLREGEHELAVGELAAGTARRIRTRPIHRWSGGHGESLHALTLAPTPDIPSR